MNRDDFQKLAEERLLDAQSLLAVQRWSGAYYIAGYSIECALKAGVAKLTNQYDFPDKSFVQSCFTHNLDTLLDLARLKAELDNDIASNQELGANWLTVRAWKEDARYLLKTEVEAVELYNAIADQTNGVMPWIKVRW